MVKRRRKNKSKVEHNLIYLPSVNKKKKLHFKDELCLFLTMSTSIYALPSCFQLSIMRHILLTVEVWLVRQPNALDWQMRDYQDWTAVA